MIALTLADAFGDQCQHFSGEVPAAQPLALEAGPARHFLDQSRSTHGVHLLPTARGTAASAAATASATKAASTAEAATGAAAVEATAEAASHTTPARHACGAAAPAPAEAAAQQRQPGRNGPKDKPQQHALECNAGEYGGGKEGEQGWHGERHEKERRQYHADIPFLVVDRCPRSE